MQSPGGGSHSVSHMTTPRVDPAEENPNKQASPAVLIYVGETPTTLPSIIPLVEGSNLIGRSRTCKHRLVSQQHRYLMSKQHATIEVWYEARYVHIKMLIMSFDYEKHSVGSECTSPT